MAKISTYPSADSPLLLSDRLIGTEAIRTTPTNTPLATKNFSLGDLLLLFSSEFPAASLQAVLNTGNTAIQNINLTGTITTDLIKTSNIEDTSGSQGTVFQFLSKGANSINWVDLPASSLQAVLDKGNTATQNIILTGNITSTKIIPGNIQDDTFGIGLSGQVLSKTASGIRWISSPSVSTPGLADILSVGNTATNDINLIGNFYGNSFKFLNGYNSTIQYSGTTFNSWDLPNKSGTIALISDISNTTYSEIPTGAIDGTNTVYTLTNLPLNSKSLLIVIDGLTQYNGIDYNLAQNSNVVTFTFAPASGSTMFAYYNFLTGTNLDLSNYATKTDLAIVTQVIDPLINQQPQYFYITDGSGNVILKIDANGANTIKYNICNSSGAIIGTLDATTLNDIAKVTPLASSFNLDSRYLDSYYLTDNLDNVILKYTADGFDVAKLSAHFQSLITGQVASSSFNSVGNFLDDINMNIIYGQSLAVEGQTLSAEDFYTATQFAQGVLLLPPADSNINDKAYNQTYFGDITNMTYTGSGLNARMVTKKWNELIKSEDGIDLNTFNFSLMGFNGGVSGYAWYQLNKQNISIDSTGWATMTAFGAQGVGRPYCHLLHAVYFGRERAHAQGKSFNVNTLSWVQGEAADDKFNTIDQYYTKLVTIFTDLNNDIKQITGQTNDVQFVIYQNSSFAIYQVPTSPNYIAGAYSEGVPLACLKAARDLSNVSLGTPLYPFSVSQTTVDKVHLTNLGYAMMSSMFGIVAKRIVTDKRTINPLYPNTITTFSDGTNYFVRVQFDVLQRPLVFDTSGNDGVNMRGHGGQPNYGFSILTSGGLEIITNVRLSTDDSVVIETSQNPVGLSMTYAWTGVFGGGNLRDSQGDIITTTFNHITYRCDNWCPFFRITI